tara:strand:+ start:3778 stop:4071 length:294 start_codon:yes stop_codon:yes gene_type:complete
MKITRRGARADNGPSSIELSNLRIELNNEGVLLKDTDIKDFVTKAHYNYRMQLSFEEIAAIIKAIGRHPNEMKETIGKSFEADLKSLLRVVNACVDS